MNSLLEKCELDATFIKKHPSINIERWKGYNIEGLQICSFCDKNPEYIDELHATIKSQQKTIELLLDSHRRFQEQCDVKKFFDSFKGMGLSKLHNMQKNHPLKYALYMRSMDWLEIDETDAGNLMNNMLTKTPYFITVTFDMNYFKFITNKEAQRRYLAGLLCLAYSTGMISEFIGCFELQQNGRVHIHAVTEEVNTEFIPSILPLITNYSIYKQKAVHCFQKEDWFEYILKEETKDPDFEKNYFRNKKIKKNL